MVIIALWLAFLGLCAGSFVNALVWRIHAKKDWVKARSQCPECGHVLAAKDLVPVFSWLLLRGRCRYCHKPISKQYPIVELAGGLIFALSYIYWPAGLGQTGNLILFISYLLSAVGLLALLVYDWRYMLLPNKILYPAAGVAAAGRLVYIVGYSHDAARSLIQWILTLLVTSGLFWLMFMVSRGKWIGYGDVRLGLVTGSLLSTGWEGLLMIFLASLLGTVFVLPTIFKGQRKLSARVPYGPFLITATFITVLFGAQLIDWYQNTFLS